jgi:Ca-activated chloride channel family protein
MIIKKFTHIVLLLLLLLSLNLYAQFQQEEERPPPITRILFVFDASQSMYGRWQSDVKIKIARKLLSNVLDSLKNVDNLELALRVYGHQKTYPPQMIPGLKFHLPGIMKIE